ncbi:MAG: HEPN domain-containing protein [Phycisphaerae bacterium]
MRSHEQAIAFLAKAAEDEAVIDEIINSAKVADAAVGFHCQQAAEKLLKALLSELKVEFRRTQDLRELSDLLADVGHPLPQEFDDLDQLTPYGVFLRYEAPENPVALDRQGARNMIARLRKWVETRVPIS